jgi:hypothetical protein
MVTVLTCSISSVTTLEASASRAAAISSSKGAVMASEATAKPGALGSGSNTLTW